MRIAFYRLSLLLVPFTACSGASFSNDALKQPRKKPNEANSSETSIVNPPPIDSGDPTVAIPENTSGSYLTCVVERTSKKRIDCIFYSDQADQFASRDILHIDLILDDGSAISAANFSERVAEDGGFSILLSSEIADRIHFVAIKIENSKVGGDRSETYISEMLVQSKQKSESTFTDASIQSWDMNFENLRKNSLFPFLWTLFSNWKFQSGLSFHARDDEDEDDEVLDNAASVVAKDGYLEFSAKPSTLARTRKHWNLSNSFCDDDAKLKSQVREAPERFPTARDYKDFAFNSPTKIDTQLGVGSLKSAKSGIGCGAVTSDIDKQCGIAIEHLFDVGSTDSDTVSAMKVRVGLAWLENEAGANALKIFLIRAIKSGGKQKWIEMFSRQLKGSPKGVGGTLKISLSTFPEENRINLRVEGETDDFPFRYLESDRIPLEGNHLCNIGTSVISGVRVHSRLRRLSIGK